MELPYLLEWIYYVFPYLVHIAVSCLIDKMATLQTRYLTTSHIGHLEIGMHQYVECKTQIFAGIIDPNVKV